mmetsp:Transcript_40026/g.105213  ORF Transcript_40026/g.105213 Transcript_40026/m.105213 type:complete len:222 (+) Transcript_40026:621-1286(+)
MRVYERWGGGDAGAVTRAHPCGGGGQRCERVAARVQRREREPRLLSQFGHVVVWVCENCAQCFWWLRRALCGAPPLDPARDAERSHRSRPRRLCWARCLSTTPSRSPTARRRRCCRSTCTRSTGTRATEAGCLWWRRQRARRRRPRSRSCCRRRRRRSRSRRADGRPPRRRHPSRRPPRNKPPSRPSRPRRARARRRPRPRARPRAGCPSTSRRPRRRSGG